MEGFLSDNAEEEELTLEQLFKAYCQMDPISKELNVDKIPLTQCDNWLREAEVLKGDVVSTTDTGLCFFKFRKRAVDYEEFLEFLQDLAKEKNLNFDEIQRKLLSCPRPTP